MIQDIARTVTAAGEIGLPCIQKGLLGREDQGRAFCQHVGDHEIEGAGQFCLKPVTPDFQCVDLVLQIINNGAKLGVLQLGKDLARFDAVALVHMKFRQNAAFEVLHDLRARR